MNKKLLILVIILIILIATLTFYFIMNYSKDTEFGVLNKEIKEDVTLKTGEKVIVDDLDITYKYEMHGETVEPLVGGEVVGVSVDYAIFDVKMKGSKEAEEFSISTTSTSNERFWNGYLIKVREMGPGGDSVTISINKFQEESFEFNEEVSLQKYRVIKNNELKITFAGSQEVENGNASAPNMGTKTGDFYITLKLANSSGKTGEIGFWSDRSGVEKWENLNFNFISFDPISESIKLIVSK